MNIPNSTRILHKTSCQDQSEVITWSILHWTKWH